MLTTIPFSGFYESHHDAELDDALDRMFSDRGTGCTVNGPLRDRALGACQWGLVHGNYAAEYARALAEKFKIAMKFESLQSPREYNFATDRIFCEIELEEVKRIRSATDEKAFRDEARNRFTSRSGFISFYSPDVDDWGDIDDWDHNQVGTLIAAYIDEQAMGFDMGAEYDLMESARCNGRLDEWIIQATPDIGRLLTIHDYLQERAA